MDFNDTKEEAQFREEVNNWLSKNAEKNSMRDIYKKLLAFQATALLCKMLKMARKYMMLAGLAFTGLKIMAAEMHHRWKRVIWGQEMSKYKVPGGYFEIGQGMAGPC